MLGVRRELQFSCPDPRRSLFLVGCDCTVISRVPEALPRVLKLARLNGLLISSVACQYRVENACGLLWDWGFSGCGTIAALGVKPSKPPDRLTFISPFPIRQRIHPSTAPGFLERCGWALPTPRKVLDRAEKDKVAGGTKLARSCPVFVPAIELDKAAKQEAALQRRRKKQC